jgi:hypothetical protein
MDWWRGQRKADEDSRDGCESDMDLIDNPRRPMQPVKFLCACFSWRCDQREERLVDPLVICNGDQQGEGSNPSAGNRTNAPLVSAKPGIDYRCENVQSEAAPAEEIVQRKPDGCQLISNGRIKAGVDLLCDAGNHKQDGRAYPCTGRKPGESGTDLMEQGSGGFVQGSTPVI